MGPKDETWSVEMSELSSPKPPHAYYVATYVLRRSSSRVTVGLSGAMYAEGFQPPHHIPTADIQQIATLTVNQHRDFLKKSTIQSGD